MFKCFFCQKDVLPEPVFEKRGRQWVLTGKAAFHFYTTHGYDPEMFIDMYERAVENIERHKH